MQQGNTVLRITCNSPNPDPAVVKVEGRVADRWVEELAGAVEATLGRTPNVLLDLSDVTFVDVRGVALLQSLQQRGVVLMACSPFVRMLLNGGPDGSLD